jgi:hypothetical protein
MVEYNHLPVESSRKIKFFSGLFSPFSQYITRAGQNCEDKLAFSGYVLMGSGYKFKDRTKIARAYDKAEMKHHDRFASVNLIT